MKNITLTVKKTETGYTAYTESKDSLSFFTDDDQGRKMLIQYLVDELLNKEVQGGVKYFREN